MDSFIPFKTAALSLSGSVSEEYQKGLAPDGSMVEKTVTACTFSCNKTFTRRRGQECGNGLFLPVKPPVLAPGDFTLASASRCCPWSGNLTVQPFDDGVVAELSVVNTSFRKSPTPNVIATASSNQTAPASFGFASYFVGNPSGGILPVTAALAGCNGGLDWDYRGMIVDLRPPKNYSAAGIMVVSAQAIGPDGSGSFVGFAKCTAVIAPVDEFPDFPTSGGSLTISGPCVFQTANSSWGPYGSLGSQSAAAGCVPDATGAGTMDFAHGSYRAIINGSGTWSLTLS